jgi:hypothetical protein
LWGAYKVWRSKPAFSEGFFGVTDLFLFFMRSVFYLFFVSLSLSGAPHTSVVDEKTVYKKREMPASLKAAYTSSVSPHTLVADEKTVYKKREIPVSHV